MLLRRGRSGCARSRGEVCRGSELGRPRRPLAEEGQCGAVEWMERIPCLKKGRTSNVTWWKRVSGRGWGSDLVRVGAPMSNATYRECDLGLGWNLVHTFGREDRGVGDRYEAVLCGAERTTPGRALPGKLAGWRRVMLRGRMTGCNGQSGMDTSQVGVEFVRKHLWRF